MNSRTTILTIATLVATVCSPAAAAAADTYKIDPRHAAVIFSVGHAGLSHTYGMFRTVAGAYVIDKDNFANSRFQLVIQAESLYTNDAERDTHLRGPEFFNVEQFPTIEFKSTACTFTDTPERGKEFLLTGNLAIHGVVNQVKVPLRMLAEGPGPHGDKRTGFSCDFALKRSDYGMKKLLENDIVGDAVRVTISFEGYVDTAAQPRTR